MAFRDRQDFVERAYDDWAWETYDEWYRPLWDTGKGPIAPVEAIIRTCDDLCDRARHDIKILDAACGTGNLYVLLTRAGYDVWATDGSRKMLECARENCRRPPTAGQQVSDHQLIAEPVAWTDSEAYRRHFSSAGLSFDLILVCANSLCHLPSTSGDANGGPQRYMHQALRNFWSLLKPGGRLLVDTKRYDTEPDEGNVKQWREMRYDHGWVRREDRMDNRTVKGTAVRCHTRLLYDVDPCFNVCRAFIVSTIYSAEPRTGMPPQIATMPYYPLPAEILEREMRDAQFEPTILRTKQQPIGGWSYDFVVGSKRRAA